MPGRSGPSGLSFRDLSTERPRSTYRSHAASARRHRTRAVAHHQLGSDGALIYGDEAYRQATGRHDHQLTSAGTCLPSSGSPPTGCSPRSARQHSRSQSGGNITTADSRHPPGPSRRFRQPNSPHARPIDLAQAAARGSGAPVTANRGSVQPSRPRKPVGATCPGSPAARRDLPIRCGPAPGAGPGASDLLGDMACEHEPHDLVPSIGGGAEHQRAASVDHGDPAPPAVAGGRGRHAARAAPRGASTRA
jgi:hypothetical protein